MRQLTSLKKALIALLGFISLALAAAGTLLPLLPTTPFLLLAAGCFMRSSDRLYRWLMSRRWVGTYIRNYREYKALTSFAKLVILIVLWVTITTSILAVSTTWVRLLLVLVALAVSVHILCLKTMAGNGQAHPTHDRD